MAEYNRNPWDVDRETITLAGLYNQWLSTEGKKLGSSLLGSLKAAYSHCEKYYGVKYRKMKRFMMQDCIDSCIRGASTKANIKNLFGHLDRFAYELDIIDKMYSDLLTTETLPETSRKPFTRKEIDNLWSYYDKTKDEWAETVLIFLYTGFRLRELLDMKTSSIDMAEKCLVGGIKTTSGKNRRVPIHDRIMPLIEKRMSQTYLIQSDKGKPLPSRAYYDCWNGVMSKLGMSHTPHECRHTFETELDAAGGNRRCIDLLMGHKSKDVGNRVYNHKTLDQLRETIALLK